MKIKFADEIDHVDVVEYEDLLSRLKNLKKPNKVLYVSVSCANNFFYEKFMKENNK